MILDWHPRQNHTNVEPSLIAMCTLTLHKSHDGIVLTSNRDELRKRDEDGVRHCKQNGLELIYPVDAKAKGTWIGVNNYGVALCLLNNYQAEYNKGLVSRGSIIASAILHKDVITCKNWLQNTIQLSLYNPFVLILTDTKNTLRFSWDGKVLTTKAIEFIDWRLESSSSVEHDATLEYREEVFLRWLNTRPDQEQIIDFHLQQAENELSRSVCMSRSATHTKSITQIVIGKQTIGLNYLSPEQVPDLTNTQTKASQDFNRYTIDRLT